MGGSHVIYEFDLHVHSAASRDGRMTLDEIVKTAKARGLSGVAVTDHDVLLQNAPVYPDFLIVPGCEFSTERGHLLGLFLSEPIPERPFPELIDAIHAQGGLAVMAHPFEHRRDDGRIVPVERMLDGMEVFNARAARKIPEANDLARAWAETHNLPGICGSDAHLLREIGNATAKFDLPDLTLAALKDAIRTPGAMQPGTQKNGRAADVARSQWTKLRKTRAPLKRYVKWVLFAFKCALKDLLRKER
jgi:predicted metal-dependent phosphoesterase TrpH